MTPPITPLMTPEEASPLMGLAPQTLKNLARAKKIQHSRPVGTRKIMFSDEDIAANRAASVVCAVAPALSVISRRRTPQIARSARS